jgi:hypothetical protein
MTCSQQYNVASLFSKLSCFEWQFKIDSFQHTKISCISFSAEDARHQLLSLLTDFDNVSDQSKTILTEIDLLSSEYYSKRDTFDAKKKYCLTKSQWVDNLTEEERMELSKITVLYEEHKKALETKLAQLYPPYDGTYEYMCTLPKDYTRSMLVSGRTSDKWDDKKQRLDTFIATTEPKVKPVNLIRFVCSS